MNKLTCVYCGQEYPEGTPPSQNQVLTDHIKICPKHPLREAEEKVEVLKEALMRLTGISNLEECANLEAGIALLPLGEEDKKAMLNACAALKKVL